jgi:hypothetical protein
MDELCFLECAAAGSQTSLGTNEAWSTGWEGIASSCWYHLVEVWSEYFRKWQSRLSRGAYTYNSSYCGCRDREDCGLRPAYAKN